jgi:4-alpha-glucanotransferase
MVRLAWASVADLAMAPIQDLLGMGSEARMNRPGQASGNWEWRLAAPLAEGVIEWLGKLTESYGRAPM